MVAQELAYASYLTNNLTMGNRDSFHPQSEGGKDGSFTSGDENSHHLSDGIRVNGPNGGKFIGGGENGDKAIGTREGFQEDQEVIDEQFAAIVVSSLGELSMRGGGEEEESDDGKTIVRGTDFTK